METGFQPRFQPHDFCIYKRGLTCSFHDSSCNYSTAIRFIHITICFLHKSFLFLLLTTTSTHLHLVYVCWTYNIMSHSIIWDLMDTISCSTVVLTPLKNSHDHSINWITRITLNDLWKVVFLRCCPNLIFLLTDGRTEPSDVSTAHAHIAGTRCRHSGKQLFLLCWQRSVNPPLEQNGSLGDVKWCVCW